uniref:Protein kinase domain-containing protein n=1 Tax=Oryza punctata TaxID=4537 RepID=A0A0E0M2A9_ORYPU
MKLRYSCLLLCGHLVLCFPAIWMPAAAKAADEPSGQRPGCPSKCGEVDIPFPFGIGPQCAMQTFYDFKIDCLSSNGSSNKPFFRGAEVTKLSVSDGKASMNMNISTYCYDSSSGTTKTRGASADFSDSPYWISDKDNKVVVIGCQTLAYMQINFALTGCVLQCTEDFSPMNGVCSGAGCCELDFPNGTWYYNSYFNENYNNSQIWKTNPCSYMAVIETTAFNFNATYVNSTIFYDTYKGVTPLALDWIISMESCDEAKRNTTSYACISGNSKCVSEPKGGYRCMCNDGYEGNPYIKDGCKDIDECLDNTTYPCNGICKNTMGGFTCSCYPGSSMMDGGSIGLVVFVIAIASAWIIRERRKLQHIKQQYFRQHGGLLLFEEMKSQQGISFKIFSEEELQQATNKFNEQQILGRGGNGTVYKGLVKGNIEVAVKRCMTIDDKKKKEFGKEMLILSQINHKNIVKLLGCCLEVEVPMLVYEFIPNNTLFHLIHGNHGRQITLDTRLQIAHESAEALSYLHSCASPPIFHGDVKSSNILLDANLSAKVSDFGASILAPTDESQFVTLVQGTCGYLDPEYMRTCQLTDKSDVYSFGVVLLELLTCKKPINLFASEHEKSLSVRFLTAMNGNKLEEILDEQIKNDSNLGFLQEIAELAKQCLEMSGANRPSMKEIAGKLDTLRKVRQHPWEEQNLPELESLLGEHVMVNSQVMSSTRNFSIEENVIMGLKSGR